MAVEIKKTLTQYGALLKEKKQVMKRIENLERQINKIENEGTLKDTVSGGDGGIQHFVIEGVATTEYSRKRMLLNERRNHLKRLECKVDASLNEIEDFVCRIDDSRVRLIISLKFIDGLSWNQVADCMGGGNSEDSVRKMFERYVENS